MIINVLFGAFLLEVGRGAYYTYKEIRRSKRTAKRFSEFVWSSNTLGELMDKVEADEVTNPELYRKVPQTWMPRLYDKIKGE